MSRLVISAQGDYTSRMVSRRPNLVLAGAAIGHNRKGQKISLPPLLVEGVQTREARTRKPRIV
jgi:hypothetical protein